MMLIVVVLALLTAVYGLTLGSLAWEDLVLGLGLSIALLGVFRKVLLPRPLPSNGRTLKAIVMFPVLAIMAVLSIVEGSWTVAMYVVGVRRLEHPGIVAVPIGERSPTAVGLSGMLLTLSPGSFLVDVDWSQRTMFIHVMDASDPDAVREDLQTFYDRYQRHVVP